MKAPYLANGSTYGTDSAGQRICTGSQMGRRSVFPPSPTQRLHLVRVRLDSGGYDQGGAYWGHGQPLYCAYSDETEYYTRADCRADAVNWVRERLPQAKFYR